ncbi:MAG: hypothetical protein AAF160_00765 [Pseudomonadota bacterium]
MSDGDDGPKDDVLVSLRRIMRGGKPAAENEDTKRGGGLFKRRRTPAAETEAETGDGASPEAEPDAQGADAEGAEESTPGVNASNDVAATDETAAEVARADEPAAVQEDVAADELLTLDDSMMQLMETAEGPSEALEAQELGAGAPDVAEGSMAEDGPSTTDLEAETGTTDIVEELAETVEEPVEAIEEPAPHDVEVEAVVAEAGLEETAADMPPSDGEPDALDDAIDTTADELSEAAPSIDDVPVGPVSPPEDVAPDLSDDPIEPEPFAPEPDIPAAEHYASDELDPTLDPATAASAGAVLPATVQAETAPAMAAQGQGGAVIMDESALEDMIRRVIRAELVEGELGRNISANVRRLIEDEIARAMLNRSQD